MPGPGLLEVIRGTATSESSGIKLTSRDVAGPGAEIRAEHRASAALEQRRHAARTALELGDSAAASSDCPRTIMFRLRRGDLLDDVKVEARALRVAAEEARCSGASAALQSQLDFIDAMQIATKPWPGADGDANGPAASNWRSSL